jgi:hypothetical protein
VRDRAAVGASPWGESVSDEMVSTRSKYLDNSPTHLRDASVSELSAAC